ncbi:HEAT repeat domain-containing protein [Botrimarina mediterranea]|uniref:HEAT repeat domain-containing protein n=1 Tax=Botrimarina mediterranea TaxID=2528022 RepID=UPI00118A0BA7|nr:PBS lyase HEAT-like repeat protein [Planctomycetes bacterium K2D]
MVRLSLTAACVAAIAAAQPAPADQVELATGSRLDARVASEPAESRSHVALESEYGRLVLDRDRVARAVNETPAEAEYRRRSPSVSDTAEAQFALANWCRDNGVAEGMRRHLARVLELDPEHAEARMLLGYQQIDGQWMTRDDVLAARGLVRWKGGYRTPQEVALLEQAEQAEAAALAWRNQLAQWRESLDGADRDAARRAEESLLTLADPAATAELLKLLADEKTPQVRRLLMKSLGSLGTPDALATLANHGIADVDPDVRAEAVDQLIASGRPGLAIPFVKALRADNPFYINNAAWALGRLQAASAIDPLIDALVTTHKRQVGNDSGGDSYSVGFNPATGGGGTFGFGGGGPKIVAKNSRNPQVLDTLVHLTGENFQYSKEKWRAWLADQQVAQDIDLRRDL